jgi:transposase
MACCRAATSRRTKPPSAIWTPASSAQEPAGQGIDYTLTLWDRLNVYLHHGHLEIDSTWIENGVRPVAVGKKAWLFVGGETTGQRAAIIYTLVECAKRHGHNPEAYLADVCSNAFRP